MKRVRLPVVLVLLGLAVSGTAAPAEQPPARPSTPQDADAGHPGAAPPDDDFIEFLGADDVGDAAWWEFLKKSAPPPQEDPGRDRDATP